MSYILAMDAFEALIGGRIGLAGLSKDQILATEDQLLLLRAKDVRHKSELLAHLRSAIPYEVDESDEDDGMCMCATARTLKRSWGVTNSTPTSRTLQCW
jgi:hypothetical protein